MWIGEQRISLKNLSKKQRLYWKEMKRIYDEARLDGFNITGQEFIEQQALNGRRIEHYEIEYWKEFTAEKFFGYNKGFDMEKAFIDNLIEDFSSVITTRRGRNRKVSSGERIKLALVNRLRALVDKYGYHITNMGWMLLPYEVRAKIDSSNASDRYEGYNAALSMLDQLVEDRYNSYYEEYDGPEE
jgi:hypothetical protein